MPTYTLLNDRNQGQMSYTPLKDRVAQTTPQYIPQSNRPGLLAGIGSKLNDLFSSKVSADNTKLMASVAQVEPPTKTPPTGILPVPPEFESHIQKTVSIYPEVHPALISATLMQESSMGTDTRNKLLDAGETGWLGGITKTGRYADMLQQ